WALGVSGPRTGGGPENSGRWVLGVEDWDKLAWQGAFERRIGYPFARYESHPMVTIRSPETTAPMTLARSPASLSRPAISAARSEGTIRIKPIPILNVRYISASGTLP